MTTVAIPDGSLFTRVDAAEAAHIANVNNPSGSPRHCAAS
jgi:hypothetical protein